MANYTDPSYQTTAKGMLSLATRELISMVKAFLSKSLLRWIIILRSRIGYFDLRLDELVESRYFRISYIQRKLYPQMDGEKTAQRNMNTLHWVTFYWACLMQFRLSASMKKETEEKLILIGSQLFSYYRYYPETCNKKTFSIFDKFNLFTIFVRCEQRIGELHRLPILQIQPKLSCCTTTKGQ